METGINNELVNKKIDSLYVLKAICAILVIDHHSYLFGQDYIAPFRVTMVPCFFMITGFFLYRNNIQEEFSKTKQYCTKAIILLITFGLFYDILFALIGKNPITFKPHIANLITGSSICGILWYLASLYQGLIVTHLSRRISLRLLYIFPIFYIAFRILNGAYLHIPFHCPTIPSTFLDLVNSTCFLSIGYIIALHYKKIKFSKGIYIIGIVLSYFFLYYSKQFQINHLNSIAILCMSVSLFLLFLYSYKPKSTYLVQLGKKHSANLYFFHIAPMAILGAFVQDYGLKNVYAIIIFFATLLISFIVNYTKSLLNKRKL